MSVDVWDVLVLLGLVGLGVALFSAWGWLSVLAYVSVVLLVIGLIGAYVKEGR